MARKKIAKSTIDCLVELNELKLKQQAFENALQYHDEVLYSLYTAELESLSRSKPVSLLHKKDVHQT
jgi:hypothetical protein